MTVLVERYALEGPLGRAAGIEVHAATDRKLQRPVAVTLVPPSAGGHASATVSRANAAAGWSHPNLVTVLDAGESPDGAFVVTDRLDGATLADRLDDGPLDSAGTVSMLDGVLAALEGLHHHGEVVGGVAAWQVRLRGDGMWALAVLPVRDDDSTPLPLGGPLPPVDHEPAGRHADLGPRADVAAVGLLAVAALTGRRPANEQEAEELLSSVSPSPLTELVMDVLATAEAQREASTATDLRHRLPGGAPEGLPTSVALPAPEEAVAHDPTGPGQRLRRMARAFTVGARH